MDYSFRYDRQLGLLLPGEKPAYSDELVLRKNHWSTDGLVGCWLCNEGGGNTIFDLSGNGNHGSFTGTVWGTGRDGPALDFDGDDYVSVGSDSSIDISLFSELSILAWVNLRSKVDDRCIVAQAISYNWALRYDVGEDYYYFQGHDGAYQYAKYTQSNPTLSTWTHVAGTWDGTTLRVYVDTVLGAVTGTMGTPTDRSSTNVNIGNRGDARYWDGLISNVSIYNRALPAKQVAELCRNPLVMVAEEDLAWLYQAVADGLSIPVAMHHYKMMRR